MLISPKRVSPGGFDEQWKIFKNNYDFDRQLRENNWGGEGNKHLQLIG